jgi:DNA-binding NarL/FixJ family response regulator
MPMIGYHVALSKILIVDELEIERSGIQLIINQMPGLSVCATAKGGDDALPLTEQLHPDLMVTDLSTEPRSGVALIQTVHEKWPDLPILVFAQYAENVMATKVLRIGARGYVLKSETVAQLEGALRKVLLGQVAVSEQVLASAMGSLSRRVERVTPEGPDLLTPREFQVYQLLGSGKCAKEIASTLFVSVKTADTHLQNIKLKLGISGANELIVSAAKWLHFGKAWAL